MASHPLAPLLRQSIKSTKNPLNWHKARAAGFLMSKRMVKFNGRVQGALEQVDEEGNSEDYNEVDP